jgi:micrococcal nuclease
MKGSALALLAVVLVVGAAVRHHEVSAQTPVIAGAVPASGGFGLVVWSGGTTAELATAAQQHGCSAASAWLIDAGQFVGYIFGAPEFVNARFGTRFPGGVPAGPFVLACRTPSMAAVTVAAVVVAVVDGDTIDVQLDGRSQRVRLILIDTPEVFGGAECYGAEASSFTKSLLPAGTAVGLERDVSETDRYGRLLRYVYLADGRMVNELIVAGGYAHLYTYPPDVKHVDRIRAAEQAARAAGRGLWSACPGASATPTVSPTIVATPSACHPSYPTVCIPPPPPDLDCPQIPYRRFAVLPPDPHRFDGDNDGIGCES